MELENAMRNFRNWTNFPNVMHIYQLRTEQRSMVSKHSSQRYEHLYHHGIDDTQIPESAIPFIKPG